ncbi:MAG: sensor/response regulator hybrid protein [Oxalobacteraceae bacterium]|nr:MAG: sensor/response regulator hybrid protein [Oxalobacteraceae bacterium]
MARQPPPEDDPHAPAVNHAGGIARLMGDNALFARVLARFRNEYRQTAAGIRHALGTGDAPQALRLVHTLKGAAGMIEAVPLRHAAQALEQVLRQPDGSGDAWQRLARLEQALERVLLELDTAAAPPAQEQACAGVAQGAERGREPARGDTVRRLAGLLDDGNGEAVDLVREAAGMLAAQLGEQRYRRLADTIEAFDFDGALAMLAEWT